MIPLQLAQRLQDLGLVWKPATGDHFVIPDRGLDDDVFVLSDMTVEVHDLPQGQIIGFNGTTEWALDDVAKDEAIWLPREDQLRGLLGGTFRSLRRTEQGYRVEIELLGTNRAYTGGEPAEAYALALAELLEAGR